MVTNPVKASLDEVMRSMEKLSYAFEDKIDDLRQKGTDQKELLELSKGANAMKDAAGIYISWARHYIERLDKTDGIDLDDEMAEG
jgi:hypothetical protein